MKLMKSAVLVLVGAVMLGSCSAPVYVQSDESTDLAKYKTYMWVQTHAGQEDHSTPTSFAEISIHNAVNQALAKEGWQEVNVNPDVFVAYDILVEKNVEQQSNPVYSTGYSRVYYNPFARRWVNVYYPSQFLGYETIQTPVKEGTVTISMVDVNNDKTVWQGWTTETMDNNRLTDAEISKAVKNIFKKFDVASK
jgi:hypothetical protein